MYKFGRRANSTVNFWILIGLSVLVVTFGAVLILRSWYSYNLRPLSSSAQIKYFSVETGSGVQEIGANLERSGLIRSSRAFETYVRGKVLHDDLQAGTYALSPSMSIETIVSKMVEGDVAKNLLTILPAKRLDLIKETFKKAGYSQAEIDSAFNPATYRGHPALASLPAGSSLEGYLYPESFQKESDTPAEMIIKNSLDEMQKNLTPNIQSGLNAQGLSLFQGITLASLILQETDDPAIQPIVSQVFYSRLKKDMLLQTDPTYIYASAIAGVPKNSGIDSPYNTYKYKGLPPGPIGNVTAAALKAAAYPEKTDYLYFVTGDDGKFRFTKTQKDHEEAVRQYCKKKCG